MTLLLKIVPIAPLCLPTSVFVFKGDLVFCTIPENVAGKSSGLTQAPDKPAGAADRERGDRLSPRVSPHRIPPLGRSTRQRC